MFVFIKMPYLGRLVGSVNARLTLAQVMISEIVGSSLASVSVLTAQGLEPASDSVSPSLSALPRSCCMSLFQK